MKKILGIIASPRRLGNCEIMVKEISRNISEPHELALLRLSDYDIRPCKGCYLCLMNKDKKCIIKDGFSAVVEAIEAADALIVASPTYFLGPNALLKCFLDRGLALYSSVEERWGKPAIGVGIAGIPGKEGFTLLGVENFMKLLLAEVKDCRMIYGALPGEIFMNEENRETAAKIADALFGDAAEKTEPRCPLCGGSTFRFMGGNSVRCMLCSNEGDISMETGVPVFNIKRGGHDLFLTLQDVKDHREWLVGMKSRFLSQKDRLKKIVLDYRKSGEWVKPQDPGDI